MNGSQRNTLPPVVAGRVGGYEEDVGSSRKRASSPEDDDERIMQSLQAECASLRDQNAELEEQLASLQARARTAMQENRQLTKILAQLKPNKENMDLAAREQLLAAVAAVRTAADKQKQAAAAIEGTAHRHISQQQPGATASESQTQGSAGSEDTEERASAETIAAAALAVNRGNPAAALVDLLHMYLQAQTPDNSRLQQAAADAGAAPAGNAAAQPPQP